MTSLADKQTWNIQDIEILAATNRAIMLINRSDQMAADQAVSEVKTAKFSVHRKVGSEGYAYSSHVVLDWSANTNNKCLLMMEEATGISVAHVGRLLKRGIATVVSNGSAAFQYPHPNGTGKVLKGQFKFEIFGHPSHEFISQLNGGELTSVELITKNGTKSTAKFDAFNATEFKSQTISLKPKVSKTTEAFEIVKSVCQTAKQLDMEEVRIKFVDASENKHTLYLDTNDASLIDENKFVRKEFIQNFIGKLDTGFSSIHTEIRDKMYYLL